MGNNLVVENLLNASIRHAHDYGISIQQYLCIDRRVAVCRTYELDLNKIIYNNDFRIERIITFLFNDKINLYKIFVFKLIVIPGASGFQPLLFKSRRIYFWTRIPHYLFFFNHAFFFSFNFFLSFPLFLILSCYL